MPRGLCFPVAQKIEIGCISGAQFDSARSQMPVYFRHMAGKVGNVYTKILFYLVNVGCEVLVVLRVEIEQNVIEKTRPNGCLQRYVRKKGAH